MLRQLQSSPCDICALLGGLNYENQGFRRDSYQSIDCNLLPLPSLPYPSLGPPLSPSTAPSLPRPGDATTLALRHSSTGSHRQRPPRGDVRGGRASAPARRLSAGSSRPWLVAESSHVVPAIKKRACDARPPRRAYWLPLLRAGWATRSSRSRSLHGRVWCPRRRLQSRRRPATTTATPCPAAAATAAACVAAASGPAVWLGHNLQWVNIFLWVSVAPPPLGPGLHDRPPHPHRRLCSEPGVRSPPPRHAVPVGR